MEAGADLFSESTKSWRWACELFRPVPEPGWSTPNRVVLELDNCLLRDFTPSDFPTTVYAAKRAPTLIVPPQAGHHSNIADYGPGQSLVEAALRAGRARVYAVEWKSADYARRHQDIEDMVASQDRVVDFVGGVVHGVGLCQGGWQTAVHATLRPEKYRTITLAGAPIDFRAGEGGICHYVDELGLRFYEWLVALGGGLMRGEYLLAGWKGAHPFERYVEDPLELYWNLDDPAYLERYRRFRDWYEHTQDLPGDFYLRVVQELFAENRLVRGSLRVAGERVDLSRIRCPVAVVAGVKDDITLETQATAIADHVSSAAKNAWTVPAGHIGVFMGGEIVRNYWPTALRWADDAAGGR